MMKKLLRQLHVNESTGRKKQAGTAPARRMSRREGKRRQRACSLLMALCMTAGLLSPMGPLVREALAAAAQPQAGETYYFDLSAAAIPGTVNTALPDTTLHYVPFVYAGSVNAYSLRSGSNGSITGSATAAANTTDLNSNIGYRSNRTLFVADYNVTLGATWDALNSNSLIFGKNYQGGNYLLRAPSGGSAGSAAGADVTPDSNEWSVLNTAGRLNNMGGNSAWAQDTLASNSGYRILRGQSGNAASFSNVGTNYTGAAYRPVLENLKTAADLSVVTLHLNGGSFNKSTGDVKIVCSGTSYTAPSSTGLVRPVNNTLSGFYWNTAADGSGTSYAEGATVPADVTALYAQWKPEEQFNLPAGQTYYFDMSEDKVTLGGTTNAALPDTSRHYVPFTYVGTINAYRLNPSGFKSGTGASATAANNTTDLNSNFGYRYDHSLFISQYNVVNSQSCNALAWTYSHNGTYDNGKYRLRMPTGGYTSNSAAAQTPLSNEWDQILNKSGSESNDGWIKNWSGIFSFVQDFYSYSDSAGGMIMMRGGSTTSPRNGGTTGWTSSNTTYGYRPVLEVLDPATVGKDGLKAVTLHLNGGTLGSTGKAADIQVVCDGTSFTAPSETGLTRPAGNTGTGFYWNTVQDGTGTSYAPGDTVPGTVTNLYAQWTAKDTTTEQFTLETGVTYYFDLSAKKASLGGTANSALPDSTWHYVPFTYTGTVNAYKLNYGQQAYAANASRYAAAATDPTATYGYCYDHSLFIADRNLTNNLTYNSLQYGWTHGNGNTLDNGNYQMRMPTGGYDVTNGSSGQFPSSNEWDQIIRKSGTTDNATGWIKNWKDNYSYVQDIYYYGNSSSYNIETRGNTSALSGTGYYYNSSNASYGYRPVLEVLNPAAVKTNGGLKAVTLDLNGGTFNGSTDDIKVVCAGASYTAPSFTGLTRPANSATFGFHWNTQADGKGAVYEAGDTVPNTVTKLYAQWTTDDSAEEQFTLATGKTYYFDLSGTSLNSTNTGTTNTKLPDTSLRYVPFTYTGTVDAYALKSAANGVSTASETASSKSADAGTNYGYRYKHSLFVADYPVKTGVAWSTLSNNYNLIYGTPYDTNYTLRALSGGNQGTRITDGTMGVIGTGTSGWPVANEWDQIISKSGSTSSSDGWIKNWSGIYTWVQDTYYNSTSYRTLRGNQSATAVDSSGSGNGYNYLPALEVSSKLTDNADALKAVTLNLNGGKFNGSTDSIQVVCAGDSFTAPSGQSLTRPTSVTTAGFHWNTQADGSGTDYQAGEAVPDSVTTLYAQYYTAQKVTEQFTLPVGGTYYFDLSSASGSGALNSSLPDSSCHYVPFTYAGTVSAYVLNGKSEGNTNSSVEAAAKTDAAATYGYTYDHSLFVSDYNIRTNMSWYSAYLAGVSMDGGNYNMRYMSGGSSKMDTLLGTGAAPVNNEWDQILNKSGTTDGSTGLLKNWNGSYSWTQDTYSSNSSYRSLRSSTSTTASAYNYDQAGTAGSFGFRPVLEVSKALTADSASLKVVTLHLNGGKLNGKTDNINIICAGSTFTAPNALGLTRPDGTAASTCWWSTAADGKGDYYAIGDKVPSTVTDLYANWNVREQYDLANGSVYYFDLSSYSANTSNSGTSALTYGGKSYGYEDGTRHYVPFTYVGTINAYALKSGFQDPSSSSYAANSTDPTYSYGYRYDHSLFVSSVPVTTNSQWNTFGALKASPNYGNQNFTLRSMSAGSESGTAMATPATNEFDQIIQKNSNWGTNLLYVPGWQFMQDTTNTYYTDSNTRLYYMTLRGNMNAGGSKWEKTTYGASWCWRPVLEVNNANVKTSDAMTAVTLNLNGGTLDGNKEIKMLRVNNVFTVPGGTGLTRPTGNATQYFTWNTEADGTGTTYVKGDTLPAGVNTLYAQWSPIEQFSLANGGTYYFDLSGQGITGTMNSSLPDSTLHYVPFTYTGTQYSYVLKGGSNNNPNSTATASGTEDAENAAGHRYDHSLFVSDYPVSVSTRTALYNAGLMFGKDYQTNYSLRSMSGGTYANSNNGAYDYINEWDQILNKSGSVDNTNGWLKYWKDNWTWVQDTNAASSYVLRGNGAARNSAVNDGNNSYNYHPVLEVLKAAALGKDGLTAVTLNLNGGTLGTTKSAADIKIICAGETYTAPSAAGIVRPNGNGSYFMWNTKQDGSGKDYAPGDPVSKSVTALYAQWTVTQEQITTLPVGNTYYFDLSGFKSNSIGTANTANPDTTWHYVPFTFDGTVYAYSLNAAAKGDNTATAAASGTTDADAVQGHTYAHSLFTGNYLLTTGVTWNQLNAAGLIYGTTYQDGQYSLRTLSGGISATVGLNDEFDAVGSKKANNALFSTWRGNWAYTQDNTDTATATLRNAAADSSNRSYTTVAIGNVNNYVPALEVKNVTASFTPVTLDLNGGSLGSNKTIQIVCTGQSYTAPSGVGLTRPSGNVDTAFHWNTKADNSGTNYKPGAAVPSTTTTLYAQWTPVEQYTLPVGETYYFDFSGQTFPGTASTALPDATLHYVPMTYGGTVNAYVLNSNSSGVDGSSGTAAGTTDSTNAKYGYRYDHSVFVSDYPLTTATSWNALNTANLIFGTDFGGGAYTLRVPSGGYNSTYTTTTSGNEWDAVYRKNNTYLKNLGVWNWMQDTYSSYRVVRGNTGTNIANDAQTVTNDAFRPLLEAKSASMTPVTLNLNGGSLGTTKSTADIKIVCTGDTYTAPSKDGLTRPAGDTDTYFMWNTQADGHGDSYAPGAKVSASVTTLYAQWNNGFTVNFTDAGITGMTDCYAMTGEEVRPAVEVKYNAANSTVPKDAYQVTYENNVNAGTATVKIVGATMGTLTKTFTILYDMSAAKLTLLNPLSGTANAYAFSGSTVKPTVSLKLGTQEIPSTAYTVRYTGNTTASTSASAPTATVTVTPAGDNWVNSAVTKSADFALVKAPEITTDNSKTYQNAFKGSEYTMQLKATGTGPITWSYTGTLPLGLSLDAATGVISGTPTEAGTYTATISAKNAADTATKEFTWKIGTVGGRMTYTDGTGAAGVTVTFKQGDAAGTEIAAATTDADGYYQASIASSVTSAYVMFTPPELQPYSVRMQTNDQAVTIKADGTVINGTLLRSVKITLNPGNGTLADEIYANVYCYPGDELDWMTDAAPTPTDTAKHFIGWFTTATGSTEAPKKCPSADATYYAQYSDKIYTVLYDTDGGGTISPKGVDLTNANLLPEKNPTKEGYTFDKWVVVGNESYDLTSATKFSELVAGTGDQKVYLKAKWTIRSDIQVTLDANGSTDYPATVGGGDTKTYTAQTYGTTISYPTPVRDGYTFLGWSTQNTAEAAVNDDKPVTSLKVPGENATYYAIWATATNTVTYDAMGGSFAANVTGSYTGKIGESYVIPTTTRTGYTFKGWFTTPSGSVSAPADGKIPTRSATYYAQWTAVTVTVTLNASGAAPETQTVTGKYGETVRFTAPQKSGYSFSGWKANDATDMFLTFPAQNTTYQAVFTAGNVAVVYNPNGGTFTGSETGVRNGNTGDSYTAPAADSVTRTGYDFAGWYTSLEGTTQAPTTTTFPPANVTYYAKWTPKTVEVTLNAGDGKFGGGTSTAIIPGTYGTVLTYTAPTREGYAFLGWKVSGTSGDAQMFLTVPATPTTYEAVWMQGGSTVTFDPMGGSFADGETGVRTGKTNNTYTAPTDPTRSGYTFAGWYTGATDGTKVENPNTYPSDSNTTYYAQWTASDVTVTLDAGENGTIKTSKYTGKYGDELAYTTPTYTGFTFKGWKLSTELDSAARTSLTYPATNTTYIAVWAANDITVTFDANGGKIGESTTSGTSGAPLESVTLPANPTREGYDFAGWYTSPTTGTKQTSIRFGYTDATYYAHWTAKQITVTMNDGTTDTTYTGSYGAVIEYTMPTKDGSAFVGWNSTGTDDGTATMFPTYPAANGTTLIAVWKTGEVNLTFNPMGGTFASGETGVRTGAAGSTYSKPADPTRTGYTFVDWYTDANCTTAATVDTTLPTESANTVYYAKWAPVSIKVTLNANDGTSASTDYTGTYGATILYTAPTRTGYTFAGWADSASATSGDMFPTYPSADKTLYAVWTANTVTLTFDANGGKIGTDETAAKTGNAESSYTAPDAPTRTGYTFDGWYDAKTGGTKKTLTGKLPTVTTTLYAHWTAETITVTLKLNGGSINSSTADVAATGSYGATINYTMPVRSGYAFKGWADKATDTAGVMFPTYETSKTLYAVWSASTVTVTFDAMGGTVSGSSSISGTPGGTYTPPTVTRTGYTFTDWYTTPSGNTTATGLGTFPTADAACYAHWTVNTVSVTLNLNGGNISGSKTDVSKSGDYGTAIDYTAPTRAGYTFKGWATDKSATTGSMSPTYTTDGTTYYAVWAAGDITVTFEPMGGTLAASDTGSFTGKTGGTYEVSTNGPTPTRTGYTFLGWFTTSSGSDKATGIGTFPETSVTYYAQWQINHPTVTLTSPDGSPDTQSVTGDYGTVVEYTVPTRAGYTFKGWNLTGNDDGTAKLNLTYPAENTTYYAVWVAGGVTVTFEPMGGTLTGETSFVGETDGHYAAPGTPTRTGYAFLGWFTKSTGGEKATAFGTYPAASTTYYAQWKINTCTVTLKSPDGSPDTQSVTGDYGTVVSYKIPVRTGYSFGGWKIENSSTAPQMSLTIPETSKNYVAVWVTGENTVTFDPNGGKFTDSTETGKRSGGYGVGYTLPAAPTRTGYDFAGWYTSLDFTTAAPTTHTFPPANVTYYAKWTAKSVTITLNAGTGAEPATQTLENQSYGAVLKYTVPTRNGFAFIGWKVRDTDDDSTAQMFLTVPAETTSYVAAWKAGGSTVSFDPMGGAFAENETGVRIKDTDNTYTTPVAPARSGYTFAGWYTGATDGDAVSDTVLGKFPTASNTTYFAHWNASQITVTLDPNDGSTQAATAEGTYGTSVSYTTPTRGGYTFSGWKLAGEENSAARMSLTFPATDTTYVAVWTANSITVTFDANGGKLDGTDTQTVGGVPQGSFTAPTPARTGYTFEGWYTSPSVGTKLTDFQFGYTNATYYAHWSASEITVTLDPNGGSIDGAQTAATRKGSYGAPIQYTIPTKAGCAFVGWRLTNDESAAATMFPTYPSENADYTAVWAASQVNLTYNPMGGSFAGDETGTRTGAAGSTYTAPVNPARTGYTFDGWYTDTNCTTPAPTGTTLTLPTASNTMYYAKWTSGTVTVKLDPNGGKIDGSAEIVTKTGSYGTTVDYGQMTLDGSQFMGWKVKGSSDNAKRSLTFPAQDAEYVAVWTDAVTVSVKYSANGGTLGGTDTYTGTPGQTWTAPGVEDRPGYTFLGWGLEPFNTTAIDHKQGAEKTFTTQSATTYYALWQATDLTITLNPNGGKFGESTESVDKTGTIGQQLLYTIPAKDGYTFCGWAETDSATDGNMFPTFTVALNGKPLYAVWKAGVVNVAFFAMGGSDNAVLSGKVGDSVAIPVDPTRTGYTFEGWYTEPDGGGNKLDTATGGSITLATNTPAAYYAKWTAETYTVTLKLNGGNISGETADVTRDGAYGAQVTYTEPTRAGYTFTGWKAEGSDTVTKFITFPAKDAAYTAQWQKNSITVTFNSMDGSDAAVLSGEAGSTLTVPADPTRTGYTFDGWSLQPISTSYVTPDDSFPTASIAYYAQWTAKTSAVTLKLNGGTIKDKKEDVTLTGSYGSVVAYTAPTRSGYTFSGWKPEGGKDEEAVLYLTYPLEDTTGYEAVWKAIPSGGGGGGISGGAGTGTDGTTVTVPVSSTEGNTHAAVTVEGGTATVSATEEQIKAVISDTEKTGTVVVDVSNLDVSSAVVPSAIVSAARTAEGGTGLKVALPTGTVTLDETALNSTNGSDVKIEVQPVAPSELNDAQKEKLGAQAESATIVDVNVYVNDVLTHTFNDGKVDVSVPYTLKPGQRADTVTVWYLADDGSITPMHGTYDAKTKTVSFTTTHLSSYVIANFPFTDVSENAWYYGNVAYVYTHGLFSGTTGTVFSPETTMTRGMLVTVLWRMAGKPAAKTASAFKDVRAGSYCADAVAWASKIDVVRGYSSTTFAPGDTVTRQQMAAILYRYAKYKGYDVSAGGESDLSGYGDAEKVSDYAKPALAWAVSTGLVMGSENNLMPASGATRAQVAAILQRFAQNIVK